jgi:CBS domain-containing protein
MRTRIVSVKPDETVQVAIARMVEEGVGSVAVCDGPRLAGIFTERDVLRLASGAASFPDVRIGDVMTRNPLTVPPDVDMAAAARMMNERGVRHLPVVEGDNLLGMLGIRDVMRNLVETVYSRHDEAARDTARELLRAER